METIEFIEKTNGIVRLLVNAAGPEDYTGVARIINKQANMDCDELINECNEIITKLKKGKVELMGLKKQINQNKSVKDFKSTWEWIATFEDGTPEWREAMNICQKYFKKYNNPEPIEYLDQIIEEHNKWKERK